MNAKNTNIASNTRRQQQVAGGRPLKFAKMKFVIAILCVFFSDRVTAEERVENEAGEDLVALHGAMVKYLNGNGNVWPRIELKGMVTEKQISKFWRDTLKPFGAQAKHWKHSEDSLGSEKSYLPTTFESKKGEAYRLGDQPWFVLAFKSSTGMWLVCQDGNPKKFESEAPEDLAALHSAMAKYLEKNVGIWPQVNPEVYESEKGHVKFWTKILKPFGAEKEHWVRSDKPSALGMDYIPAIFDDKKDTAYRWEKQPWFVQTSKGRTGLWIVSRNGRPRIGFSAFVPSSAPDADARGKSDQGADDQPAAAVDSKTE